MKPSSNRSVVIKTIVTIRKHQNVHFLQDIPLYLLLSYRLHTMIKWYDCEEVQTFITECVKKLENENPITLAQEIKTFTDKYVH